MGEALRILKEREEDAEAIRFSPAHLATLIALVDQKAITTTVAKEIFEVMFTEDIDPSVYAEEKGLKTVHDESALRRTVEQVIADNPQSVADYRAGKKKCCPGSAGEYDPYFRPGE